VVSRLRFSGLLTTGVVAVWLLATVLAPAAGRFIQNVRVAQAQGLDLGHAIGDSLPALVGQPTVEQTRPNGVIARSSSLPTGATASRLPAAAIPLAHPLSAAIVT